MHGTYPYRQALDDPGTRGVDRREFVRICTMVASAAGLGSTAAARFVEAATNGLKPSVIWLHIQECTGCSESLLRASHPAVADRKRRERKAARASRLCRGHSL